MRISNSLDTFASQSPAYLLLLILFCQSIGFVDAAPRASAEMQATRAQTGAACSQVSFRQAPEFAVGQNPKGVAAAGRVPRPVVPGGQGQGPGDEDAPGGWRVRWRPVFLAQFYLQVKYKNDYAFAAIQ